MQEEPVRLWEEIEQLLHWLGMLVLLGLVVVCLLLLGFVLGGYGMIVSPLKPDYEGVELAAFPLAALAGVLLHHRLGWLASLHGKRVVGPYLPLLAAGAVVGMLSYLPWYWRLASLEEGSEPPELLVMRAVGVVLVAGGAIAGITVYPRVFATLAGALAGPSLFGIIAFLGVLASPDSEFLRSRDHSLDGLLLLTLVGGPALIGASVWLRVRNPNPPPPAPRKWTATTPPAACPSPLIAASAAWSAGVMLILTVKGLVAPWINVH